MTPEEAGMEEEEFAYSDDNELHEKLLNLGELFLQQKLTPIYYIDRPSNTTFIIRFEKANHGLH